MREKLIKSTVWSYAAKISATVLFFAADILIARILDLKSYAEWAFFFSILSMGYYLFWFGVNSSTRVFVSKTAGRTDERGLCIRAGFRVRMIVSLALTVLSFGVVLILPAFSFFRELGRTYPLLHHLLLFAPFIAGLNSFAEFYKETEIGVQQYRGLFILTAVEYGAILIAAPMCAARFHSAEGAGIGFLAAYGFTFLAGLFLTKRWNGIQLRRRRDPESRLFAAKIFRYAIPLAAIGIGGVILVDMDTFMLGILGTPEDVSGYAIAKQICTKASHINNALAMGTLTSFSVIAAEEYAGKRRSFARIAKVNICVTLGTGLAMFLLAGPVISILYGEQYAGAARIIRCLVPYYMLYGLSAFYALFLDYHGKAGRRSLWFAIMVIINLVLNLLLIPQYGTTGACVATAVSLVPYTLYLLYESYLTIWKGVKNAHESA